MQSTQHFQKQMSSTNRKEKIFNVRRIHYKQFDHQKYLKPHFSPLHKKQQFYQHPSQKVGKKTGENYFQMQIMSSLPYKQLTKKFNLIKQQQAQEKQKKFSEVKQKQQQYIKINNQRNKLLKQKQKIMKKRDQLREKISQLRQRNQAMRAQQAERNEQYRIMNMQYFRDMIISMRYQNGIDIDPDRMTYEQLLQLQEQMGSVSKGLPQQMIKMMPRRQYNGQNLNKQKQVLCSICYCDVKIGQQINELPCGHVYHYECIKEWLLKNRVCPMCKRQIMERVDSAKQVIRKQQQQSKRESQNQYEQSSRQLKNQNEQNSNQSGKQNNIQNMNR